jgi:crotonobetainyl-CoA:carnitine CoA-transferase CaiB-like acyl-CoA transferase
VKPLDGIRVLEIGSTVAGPAAGRLLADFGAEVIKVEPPEGDHLRTWGTPAPDGTSWWFKSHNRNKSFVRFDLHQPQDAARVREIALQCDVILENFRPGKLAEWGLSYEQLRAERPGIIFVSISGYGQDGPFAKRPGFGNIAECLSGLRYMTGYADRPPVRTGISIGDEIAGLYAVIGTTMALLARSRTGVGDHVDVSLVESSLSLMEALLPEYVHAGTIGERTGNRFLRASPNGTYRTRDERWLSISANSQPIFRRLCGVIGRPELADDPRFATNQARIEHAEALDATIAEWVAGLDLREAAAALVAADIPTGPVYSIADIVADEQMQARAATTSVPDEHGTPVATYAIVPRLLNHPGGLEHAARPVGYDQTAVSESLGLAKEELPR